MGSQTPPSYRNMLHLWKLFTVIVILQACLIYNNDAKQLQKDFTFDDTFDIDQFDDDSAISTKNTNLRTSRDLDAESLLEDELQPAEDEDLLQSNLIDENDDDESGWFVKGVRRVRRELGRFFGSDSTNDDLKTKKHHKKRNSEGQKHRKNKLRKSESLTKKLKAERLNKHSKRDNGYDDEPLEGSGTGGGEGESPAEHMKYFETYFLINEPWVDTYSYGRLDSHFAQLEQNLYINLRSIFLTLFSDDADIDSEMRIILDKVEPSQDSYKVYVTMTFYLPDRSESFYRNTLYNQITTYHRIGSIGAEVDEKFYFREYRDSEGEVRGEGESTNGYGENDDEERRQQEEEERRRQQEDEERRRQEEERRQQEEEEQRRQQEEEERRRQEGEGRNEEEEGRSGFGYDENDDEERRQQEEGQRRRQEEEERRRQEKGDTEDEESRSLFGYDKSDDEEKRQQEEENERRRQDEERRQQEDEERRRQQEEEERRRQQQEEERRREEEEGRSGYPRYPYGETDDGENRNEVVDTTSSWDSRSESRPVYTPEIEASGDSSWDYTTESYPVYGGCRGDAYFTCPDGKQICDEQRCDYNEDCENGEDELDCDSNVPERPYEKVCSDDEFKCDDRCLPKDYRCNGVIECIDRTDEEGCPTEKECQPHEFKCRSGDCIDARYRCDREPHCPDGDDEDDRCPATHKSPSDCSYDEFYCDDDCHPMSLRCNNYQDCTDGSDELNCPRNPDPVTRRPPTYPCPQHTCPNGKCYTESQRCDNVRDCDDGSDESNCSYGCAPDEFRCRDGGCISSRYYCDGRPQCRDGSDEDACTDPTPGRSCLTSQFRCDNGQCINKGAHCDGYTDCADSSDERNCSEPPTSPAGQLYLKTYPDSQIIKERREVIFRCRDEGPLRARVRWTRPGGQPLPAGFSDKNGRLEIPNIRVEDSGQYICEAVGYPRHVPGQQVTVHLTVERFNPLLDRPPTACHPNQATCMNGECIDKSQICDGTPHCSDGSDEHSCSHGRKCHPNQFMCRNSKCVDRIWRCDGENDCGDNSDEDSCEPEPSGAPCRYDEFQCKTGHCIPKSFQCDDTNDCVDGSDEIGCVAPSPIRPPPPSANLRQGESLNLTCVGAGNPVPVIVWRLNWGHVPDKCVSKSYSGTGTLFCPDMQPAESGAYSCEIINSKGSHFVTPDTLVTVDSGIPRDVCQAGFFNMLARRPEECISCFCFGVSKNCNSANLFNFALQPPITSHRVVNVDLNPYGTPTINEAPSSNVLTLHHGVQFRASDVQYASRETPYLALPGDYLGNQLKSYGGYLRYDVNYMGNGRPSSSPDVIITGNGMALVHRSPSPTQPNVNNKVSVQFTAGNWNKPDGRSATREEIMMVLAGSEHILIRLSYIDSTEREVELTNIVMDSAGLQDQGLGAASLVEHCKCPVGYVGDSCETCAPGFVRQPGGPWLGRCVPFVPEPCAPGTYGDPRRGIPCRECPCPLAGSNNFASGCKLGPDGEVTCDCHQGYAGRRCEMCASGYEGNPLIPGGDCHRIPEINCNVEGTYYPHPNGTCECKPLVIGPRCDMCAPESFNLNSYTYTGCTECFCSGLTKQCSSSSWYRDQISSTFGRTRAPHGFTLITDYEQPQPSAVQFDVSGDSLQFSPASSSEPLYWNLPAQFLGDKITAYGGKLNYTLSYNPLPGGLMSRNNAPDVVIKSGEDLTIIHYRKAGVNPSQSSSYSVPIIESAWQRSDGQVVNREHLLMALSKIDAIYIKATYTTSTKNAALMQVSFDIATQNNIGTSRAVEVEECRCPVGYVGLSCERCAPGYKRDTEAGLYLGICEPCECNGHSDQCDAETGVCLNCAHNTEGEMCDRCIEGYVGNPTAGTQYDCEPDVGGDPNRQTTPRPGDQRWCSACNSDGTSSCDNGVCQCKPNVVGSRCDQCRPGTYGLHESNHDGCSECYCSGKATQCHSASLYRQLIPIDFIKDPPLLTDEDGNVVDTENLRHDLSTNQYTYSYPSYTQKFWSLRGSVLGNQLHSYGGDISYNLQVQSSGDYAPGPDVILIGNGLKLTWSRPRGEDLRNPDYQIRLHEDNRWYRIENGRASVASRLDLMQVLSNLDHILLRATPFIPTQRTSLRDVILESAVEHPMPGAQHAMEVELCTCPPEYSGNSCENCAPLHYRDSYGNCVSCPCQEDSTSSCDVDASGYVVCRCKPGHKGDRCQIFDNGLGPQIQVTIVPPRSINLPAGDSLTLTCTARLLLNNNPVPVTWHKENDEMPYNSRDQEGVLQVYDLGVSDTGVYICKAISEKSGETAEDQIYITVKDESSNQQSGIIGVAIDPPKLRTMPVGSSALLICTGSLEYNNTTAPVTLSWHKQDDNLPYTARDQDGVLQLTDLQAADSGIYVCKAESSQARGYVEDTVSLIVQDDDTNVIPTQPPPPEPDYYTQISVSITPPKITIIPVGGSLTLSCRGNLVWNNSPVLVSWYKKNDEMPYDFIEDDGVLQLYNLQIYDSGVYICKAVSNQTGKIFEDEVSITITEGGQRTPARIESLPDYYTFTENVPNQIVCEISGSPAPTVTWTRLEGQMSHDVTTDNNKLIFLRPRQSDQGYYRCQATNPLGTDEKYTQISVVISDPTSPPQPEDLVYIDPPNYTGERGDTIRLVCQQTGTLSLNYQWTKDGYPIYPQANIEVSDNIIDIIEARSPDSGTYTCTAIDQRGRRNYTSSAIVRIIEPGRPQPPPDPTPQPGNIPTIKRLPEEHRIIQGHDFSLTCEASGTPYPNIKWTKVHESLADNVHPQGNVLRIINARPENRGMYLCIAENSAGSDQSHTVIDVEPRERPTVDVQPAEPQSIHVGNEAALYCSSNGIPEPRVEWRRVDGKPMPISFKEDSPGYVIINNIRLEDAGDYECIAENDIGKATAVSTIRVIQAPVISLVPNEEVIRVTEGDELKVICSAEGSPSPAVKWDDDEQVYRTLALPGAPEVPAYNQAYLEIYRVDRTHSKTYKCVATNEAGTDERYITVDVQTRRGDVGPGDGDVDREPYRPPQTYPTRQPQPPQTYPTRQPPRQQPYDPPQNIYRANEGDAVTLTCDLLSTQTPAERIPYLETRWERVDGRPLPSNSHFDRNSLIITRVEEENSGKYRCNALDNRGTVVTFIIAELVLVPIPHITFHPKMPIVVTANENVDIYCEVTGEQPIDVSWHTDNNRPLPPSVRIDGQYLRFVSITPADAGRYYCSAANRYGNTTNMAEVVVNRDRSYEQPHARRYDINEGEDVTLTCDVQASREPIRGEILYKWHREDNRPLPSTAYISNQILYLRAVRKEDEGRYVCESYTTAGYRSQPSYVDLNIKPGIPAIRPPPYLPPPTQTPIQQYTPPPTPPPQQQREPSLKLDQQASNLRVGESTQVECYSSDNAYTDVIWERADGSPLPLNMQQIGNSLIINHVTATDAGTYVCKCKTDEGDLYTTSYELGIEATEHEWKQPRVKRAKVGTNPTISCNDERDYHSPRWSRQYGQMQTGRELNNDHLNLIDVQSNDAGTYICTVITRDGETVDYPTILVVEGAIPHFHQDPNSYMAFPTLPDSTYKLNFDITFRPEKPNGLLLFNGQQRGSGDYISLSLNDRYPEFRFDFDGKHVVVRAEKPVTLNEWHTVRVNRFRRDGYLQVVGQHPVAFPNLGINSPLDLVEDLYIGGVPNWEILPENAIDQNLGLVGCVSRLTLQGKIIELMKEAKFKEGIDACHPCKESPCENGGICLESQTETAFTCICAQGWTGHNCGVYGTQCTPGVCGTGRCENTEFGMECLCPLNKTGNRCQLIEHLNENSLSFKANSYAAYSTPRASKLNIKLQIRPNSLEDSLLLYAAESKLPSGDYFALVLHDQHVEMITNTGARLKPVIVRSLNPIEANKWTEIEVGRRFGEGILRVGNEPEQRAKSGGLARMLYIKTALYVGGHDNDNIQINRDINITRGFDGCISKLYESQRQINLLADIQDAANINNCGEDNEIDHEPSDNYERPPQTTAAPTDAYNNYERPPRTTAAPTDACASDPCENGGTCSLNNDHMAHCDCPIGFTGIHCEEHISLEFGAKFIGNGYLELNRTQFDENIEQKYSFAAIVFSTTDPNGLLLWWGQPKGVEYLGQDFMALAIVDGIVEFSFRLNGEETSIRNPDKRVNDGRRHVVLIKRTDNTAMLELDHLLDAGEATPTGKNTMSLPGHVFIGGTPDVAQFTGNRYHKNFNGCIHVVEGDSSGTIPLGKVAVSGVNVDTCPQDDVFGGTEPPVV